MAKFLCSKISYCKINNLKVISLIKFLNLNVLNDLKTAAQSKEVNTVNVKRTKIVKGF